MKRENILSGSWYPAVKAEIDKLLSEWTIDTEAERDRFAGIVPHAGWYFSGRIAANVLKKVCTGRELVIVIGGHLPPGSSILAAYEEDISLPGGNIRNRKDLIEKLRKNLRIAEDIFQDNTVEVVAAMLSFFSPGCSMMWLRAPCG